MKRVVLISTAMHIGLFAGAMALVPHFSSPPDPRPPGIELDIQFAPLAPRVATPSTPPPAQPRVAPAPVAPIEPVFQTRAVPQPANRAARIAMVPQRESSTLAPHAEPVAPAAPETPAATAAVSAQGALAMTAMTPTVELPAAPSSASGPRIDVGSLLTSARMDTARVGVPLAARGGTAPDAPRDLDAQARGAAQGYVNEVLAGANAMEPSRLHAYYGALARRMRETWRPGFYRTPSMVDALLSAPRQMVHYREVYRHRASTFALTGRPDTPGVVEPVIDFADRNTFAAVTTSSIVEVEQDESGRVTSVRVVREARVRGFDDAALQAVRVAIPQENPMPIPGGRRSRWAFDVVASRDVILPIAGFSFNESNGFFEMHYPGALHVRTRVRPIGSRRLDVAWPLPRRD